MKDAIHYKSCAKYVKKYRLLQCFETWCSSEFWRK